MEMGWRGAVTTSWGGPIGGEGWQVAWLVGVLSRRIVEYCPLLEVEEMLRWRVW